MPTSGRPSTGTKCESVRAMLFPLKRTGQNQIKALEVKGPKRLHYLFIQFLTPSSNTAEDSSFII